MLYQLLNKQGTPIGTPKTETEKERISRELTPYNYDWKEVQPEKPRLTVIVGGERV